MYLPLSRVLLRAPLLPAKVLARARRALLTNPLGQMAIEIASPALAGAAAGASRERAIVRYARRAAFRPTPSGLLAGVCMGTLGRTTDVATGTPVAHLAPSWARLDALARALLDEPAVRERVRLRVAPSAVRGAATVHWVGPGDPMAETHTADLDDRLRAILELTDGWAPWPEVRACARAADADADAGDGDGDGTDAGRDADADELLLVLIDDGLLQTDLAPPLVGAAPGERLRDRLAAIGWTDGARLLETALAALTDGDLVRGRAALAALPGRSERDIHAVLVHRPRKVPRLERAAVERAARLVPVLVRLQEALTPPAAERFASRAIADALDASTEIFGAGAFDLAALAAGDYGVELADGDTQVEDPAAPTNPSPALLALLVDTITNAARGKQMEAELDPEALSAALADHAVPPLPATAELFLVPTRRPPGGRPGAGWLLGLHAPAGASFGRFAHALGAPLEDACAEIAAAERRARPDQERLDVAFAPSAALGDLCAHPKVRPRTLALTRWTDAEGDLAPRDLELLADPAAPTALALRTRGACVPIVPSPLSRVRSRAAPAGVIRLLAGWSLHRQHAPWAFSPGPLADLAFIPRLVVDGFVIAPASWRLPQALRGGGGRAALSRWRRAARVPRFVQVGEGDQLFPVDLSAPDARADLAALAEGGRIFEIWPPLDAVVDRDGRRIEAVVAVVDDAAPPGPDTVGVGRVPPPREAPPLPGWRTFKLFGTANRQDELLAGTVAPAIRRAQDAHEIDAWFFLRYVDGPGRRTHLRLRVHGTPSAAAFEARLLAALAPAREDGAFATIEIGEYLAEHGRFTPADLPVVHAIFESDSEAAVALLADPDLDRVLLLARALDTLASGAGLNLDERHALARARRRAAESWTAVDDEDRRQADADFRRHGRALRAALSGAESASPDGAAEIAPATGVLARHRARIAAAARDLPADARARLLPTLLHLCAVRFAGPDPDAERIAYTFWERTLEGLRKSPGLRKR
jgi:lantibiotic biosynthesis protein